MKSEFGLEYGAELKFKLQNAIIVRHILTCVSIVWQHALRSEYSSIMVGASSIAFKIPVHYWIHEIL